MDDDVKSCVRLIGHLTDFLFKQNRGFAGLHIVTYALLSVPGRHGNILARELDSGHKNRTNKHFPTSICRQFSYK